MPQSIPDLWPTDFGEAAVVSPTTILRQQGQLLGEHIQNLVVGKVYSRSPDDKKFVHLFALFAPLLGFEKAILRVTHEIALYPARLSADVLDITSIDSVCKANNPGEFLDGLRKILQSEAVKKIVQSLLAQTEGRPSSASA